MLNRAAILLHYRQPAVDWVNQIDPAPDTDPETVETINEERTVYLISDADAETQADVDAWIEANHEALFESELEEWCTEPDLWPADRSLKAFREWFDVRCHTLLIDTVGEPIEDDGL